MDYIKKFIEEQVANRKLFNAMMEKWREQNHNLSEEEVESIFDRFAGIKNGLTLDKPQVATFLLRFDGRHYERFEPRFIKDLTKYSYEQIMFLLGEYAGGEQGFIPVEDDGDFGKDGSHLSEENILKSKNMWYGNTNKIIDEDGFRIYVITDQKTSIKFGYFLQYSNASQSINTPIWCVARYGGSNLWSNYRDNRTFYFIIDESKSDNDEFRFAALQRVPSVHDGYMLTSRRNNGDNTKSWDEIVVKYPKIANHKDKIASIPYKPKEELNGKAKISILDMVSEEPGQYYFPAQPSNIKQRYIAADKILAKPESWRTMQPTEKALYINKITKDNYRSKVSNYDFFMEIKSKNADFSSLKHRLETVGVRNGAGSLYDYFLEHEFRIVRHSLVNPNIRAYRSTVSNKVGLFDTNTYDWYEKDGVIYSSNYAGPKRGALAKNAENPKDMFLIYHYKHLTDQSKDFYCVAPYAVDKYNGYLLSNKAFEEFKPHIIVGELIHSLPKSPKGNEDLNEKKLQ